jgi:catechol 2,3-dioxygenase-like lactoylglutathione lyase family enzyme
MSELNMQINKQITFLPTKDLQSTTHFYTEIIGLQIFLDQGDCVIFRTCDNAYIGFCEREFIKFEGRIILTFIVDDVDEIYENLISQVDIVMSPPTINQKYQIYHFFITDPNGYLVEIQKFLNLSDW